jgi:hypothetical protein
VVADKQALCQRTLDLLGTAKGAEAEAIRGRMHTLARKYDKFAVLFNELLPALDGPIDLEALVEALPTPVLSTLATVARKTIAVLSERRGRSAVRSDGS